MIYLVLLCFAQFTVIAYLVTAYAHANRLAAIHAEAARDMSVLVDNAHVQWKIAIGGWAAAQRQLTRYQVQSISPQKGAKWTSN